MNVVSHNVRKVLTPTDFSDRSRRAIQYAVDEARLRRAELHLFHCVTTVMIGHPMDGTALPVSEDVLGEAQRSLLNFPEDCEGANDPDRLGLKVVRAVDQGNPELTILEYAREHLIDLIVLGTHARSGVERFLLGSTAEAILRHAPCPVLIVPPPGNE
ncbi:MAG: nucleotide-binding universal stress UspA family protein [Planctomycetaceae bacterium]|jgi:nucleotide-binding universal stress UspA family protein